MAHPKSNDIQLIVFARDLDNLRNNQNLIERLFVVCGTIGSFVAKRVIENNGNTQIALSKLRMGFDTQSGAEALFDNFKISVAETGEPLINFLAKEVLRAMR